MKWFKHENTFNNPKIEVLTEIWGIEGYGVYFALLELIANNIYPDNQNDWGYLPKEYSIKYLAKKLHVEEDKLGEIIDECIRLNLFEDKAGRIYCKKILERCDDYTSRLIKQSPTNSEQTTDKVVQNSEGVNMDKKQSLPRRRIEEEKKENRTEFTSDEVNSGNAAKPPGFSIERFKDPLMGEGARIIPAKGSVGEVLKAKYNFSPPQPTQKNGITRSWQEEALRIAKDRGITLQSENKPSWFKIFKQARELGRKTANLEKAISYTADHPNWFDMDNEARMNMFFYIYENGLNKNNFQT